jgi:HK97 family phage portal protein
VKRRPWSIRRQQTPLDDSRWWVDQTIGPNTIAPMVRAVAEGYGFPWIAGGLLYQRVGSASRCLQLVSQQIATMPLRQRGPGYEPAWLHNPEPALYNGLTDALFAATWCIYARGNAYLWVTSRYETGYPATWVVLDPTTIEIRRNGNGEPVYFSNRVRLETADVLHIRRDSIPGTDFGTAALEAYWANLASAWTSQAFAADFFAASGVPAAVLKWDRRLTKDQAEALQGQWVAAVAARGGAPAVLDQGLSFEVLSFSPKDLMLLELREFDDKAIASAFGVPAFLLNLPQADGLNYSNPEMLFGVWWRSELMPAAHRIEVALSRWLPRGNWVEFDPSVLLRPDLETMANIWTKLLAAGVVTENEVRAAVLDLPPLSEGEALDIIDEPGSSLGPSAVTHGPGSLELTVVEDLEAVP